LRNLLYYRLRRPSGPGLAKRLDLEGPEIVLIGDALKAGKAREAIGSAFDAALLVVRDRLPQSPSQASRLPEIQEGQNPMHPDQEGVS
jgi:hypothetical protein